MAEILASLGVHWMSLLAQAVNFSVVAYILYRFVIKPALKSLDERVQKQEEMETNASNIDAKLAEIEAGKEKAIAEARAEGKRMVEETQNAAKKLEEKLKADAEMQAAKILSDAKSQIENERAALYEGLKREVSTLVAAGIEKTIGKYVDSGVQKKMAEEAVSEIAK